MMFFALLLAVLCPAWAVSAEIEHVHVSVNTDQTTSSSTFVDVSGATISNASLTAGKQYAIIVSAQCSYTSGDGTFVRLVHGSTEFDGTLSAIDASSTGWRQSKPVVRVWTAVGGEDVKLQFRSRNGGANVAYCNFVDMWAINLDDDLTTSQWKYHELSTDDTMSTSFEDGATVTVGAGTWMVWCDVNTNSGAQTTNYVTVRISDGTNVLPQAQVDVGVGSNSRDLKSYGLMRPYTVASSATYVCQYKISASTTGTHLHSTAFALDLTAFAQYATAYTEADANLGTTDFADQLQTVSITPAIQGDVAIFGYWGFDRGGGAMANQRLQIDGSDARSGETTAVYDYRGGIDGTDEEYMVMGAICANCTAAAHTIDMDGSVDTTTGAPSAQQRSLVAFTLELAATGGAPARTRMLLGVGQ